MKSPILQVLYGSKAYFDKDFLLGKDIHISMLTDGNNDLNISNINFKKCHIKFV